MHHLLILNVLVATLNLLWAFRLNKAAREATRKAAQETSAEVVVDQIRDWLSQGAYIHAQGPKRVLERLPEGGWYGGMHIDFTQVQKQEAEKHE